MVQNKGLIFKEVPTGHIEVGKHIAVEAREFDKDQAPPSGGFRDAKTQSYVPAFPIGEAISNAAIATVIKSDVSKLKPGQTVVLPFGYTEEYSVIGKDLASACHVLDNPYNLDPKIFTGALGMPGLTAYSSLYEIGKPRKGETIFISAASGAVGQLVGQLAKHEGLKVIGSVGDDKKLEFITKDLGFDGGFNYKKEDPLEALKRLAPDGIDIYYENVGGVQLEAALAHMKNHGRIVACGMISQYNLAPEEAYGVKNLMNIVAKSLTMKGFIVLNPEMGPKWSEEHQKNVQKWLHDGSFKAEMTVTEGIDNAGEGLTSLFAGKNFGKAVLEVSKL